MQPISNLLNVDGLTLSITTHGNNVNVVEDLSFSLSKGETLAIVGESGCGKTMTALSLLRLEPQPVVKITKGSINLLGTDITRLSDKQMRRLRAKRIAMVFQDPMSALNPTMKIGDQIMEAILAHFDISKKEAHARAVSMLGLVRLPDSERQMNVFPHQLSGGMRQRVVIAIALSCEPDVIVADEPTTALDVTIQAQILALLKELQAKTGIGIILITHDLSVVRRMADRTMVMYAGRMVETGETAKLLSDPRHPYTRGLMGAAPAQAARPLLRLAEIPGVVPAPGTIKVGCAFYSRCSFAEEQCAAADPSLFAVNAEHLARCIRLGEIQ